MPLRCPECGADSPIGVFYCQACESALIPPEMIPGHARRAAVTVIGPIASDVIGDRSLTNLELEAGDTSGPKRYRIVLGDACPICRAVSRITFVPERPPQIPIAGCREADGCRCSLPVFGEAEPAAAGSIEPPILDAPPQTDSIGIRHLDLPTPQTGDARQSALMDEETGSYTWPAFAEISRVVAGQASRRGTPLGVLLVALDDSPALAADSNPLLEHAAVLGLMRVIQQTIRSNDVIGRYGQRSFGVLTSDAPHTDAVRLAETIREAYRAHLLSSESSSIFSLSIGVASLPDAGVDFDHVLEAAEQALGETIAHGGNSTCALGSGGTPEVLGAPGETAQSSMVQADLLHAELTARRRHGLAEAAAAFNRKESEGVALHTQVNACPVCLSAAEEVYLPRAVPPLPLIGCSNPGGCRCIYALPVFNPRRGPPPLRRELYQGLNIPRRLHDAAMFGFEEGGHAKPESLAEYLDAFPLLPSGARVPVRENEVVFLQCEAKRSWELSAPVEMAAHGPLFPMQGELRAGVRELTRPPTVPAGNLDPPEHGVMLITNWRVLFRGSQRTNSLLLVDIAGVELISGGLACRVGQRANRLCFFTRQPVQTGLILTRAVRDARVYLTSKTR
jgi:diguanylate cyclase (GGDEF)-like protein